MAPISAPLTPQDLAYVEAKTPDILRQHEAKSGVSPWSVRYGRLANLAQALIVASMGVYIYGQLCYFSDYYNEGLSVTIGTWWGVPLDRKGKGDKRGHAEMVRPTFFGFFGMLPIFLSVFLFEFLRHYNVRRVSSKYLLKMAMVLRRKPRVFNRVSYWSLGEWIFMGFLVGGNILVFGWYYHRRYLRMQSRFAERGGEMTFETYLEMVALTLGFSCVYNLAFLFLPATRNCVWMEFLNISYANGIKYHRWLGVVTVLTALLHCIGYYWSWLRQGIWKAQALPCFDCPLDEHEGHDAWFNVFGELALLCFLAIGITSIPFVRRKLYDLFYYVHQLFIFGVIFAIMHWAPIVWWVLPTFLLYCYSRAVSSSNAFTPVAIKELTALDNDIVKLVIQRSPERDGHFKVGQFLYLNVPSVSKLQWHAFTIASSPRASSTTLTILLKSLGDWTNDLVGYANECKKDNVLPTVYVDGFYGSSLEMYDEYSTVALVGGGIGATPMFAILEDMVARLAHHAPITQRVVFIFSFRELALLEEIHPVLLRLRELDPQETYFKLRFYMTRTPSEEVLNQSLDHDRMHARHIQSTQYALDKSKVTPQAFFEPLRSRTIKALVMLAMLAFAWFTSIYLEYGGGKIDRDNTKLWPLQQFVQASMLYVSGGLVFALVIMERVTKRRAQSGGSKEVEMNVFHLADASTHGATDVHTYRDLLSHYNVTLGQRPPTKSLMTDVFEFHRNDALATNGLPVVGVFVSGPEAMKRDVEYATADLGSRHFDIHEEEFEM